MKGTAKRARERAYHLTDRHQLALPNLLFPIQEHLSTRGLYVRLLRTLVVVRKELSELLA